jgi:RNA 3'-terminal phosphate cyclase-like protein
MASIKRKALDFSGHLYLRQHLLLSLLSQRQVIIKDIRSDDENPGLSDFEMSLLGLI